MPEGDTIFRTATTLRPAMEGGVIERATVRDGFIEPDSLTGGTVKSIEARGKHLLMHLSNEHVIHSHMGMTGSWHVYHAGQPWQKPSEYAALVLAINRLEVICFSPKMLELLRVDQLRTHRYLRSLGPDLLAGEFDAAAVTQRFRPHNAKPLGEAVMNQTIVCGIGNIYKSEILFIMGFDPLASVAKFTDDELTAMLEKARWWMRRNLGGPMRVTRYGSAGAGRHWVYGKSGTPCPKCNTTIQLIRQGEAGRTTCWCPACQPAR